jgi:predicted nucleic acid-binding protein
MILVDTSVWVDHLRSGEARLESLLEQGLVFTHPFIVGELACGRMRNREEVIGHLQSLPRAPIATDDEALHYIDTHQLMGRGIGFVDAHLLTSTALSAGLLLWTKDRRLADVAAERGLAYTPPVG